ncbi:hypothetical protein G4B88_005480 [Cannabis sativa]|uniref:Uncharacterized protein n=1 Tax=Cannabis sativa TaxID=3483 RepID=A0A7J6HC70_CANSA|nr:hypothetical protein G4B88_005480 [Cannabis sativa]
MSWSAFRSTIFRWPDSMASRWDLLGGNSNRQWQLLRGWDALTIVDDVVWKLLCSASSSSSAVVLCDSILRSKFETLLTLNFRRGDSYGDRHTGVRLTQMIKFILVE